MNRQEFEMLAQALDNNKRVVITPLFNSLTPSDVATQPYGLCLRFHVEGLAKVLVIEADFKDNSIAIERDQKKFLDEFPNPELTKGYDIAMGNWEVKVCK